MNPDDWCILITAVCGALIALTVWSRWSTDKQIEDIFHERERQLEEQRARLKGGAAKPDQRTS